MIERTFALKKDELRRVIGYGIRQLFAFIALVIILAVLLSLDTASFGSIDFVEYWSSAQLFGHKQNPYNSTQLLAIQRTVIGVEDHPILMWNPPQVFTFLIPLITLDFGLGRVLWIVLGIILIILGVKFSLKVIDSGIKLAPRHRLVIALFLLTFYPFALSLYYGQISPLLLFGFATYLYLRFRGDGLGSFGGGFALSLTLLKPHLLYLIYLELLISSIRERKFGSLIGIVSGLLASLLIPLLFFPEVLVLYLNALNGPPLYWQTPTLGSLLQGLTGNHTIVTRFLPTFLGGIFFLLINIRRREKTFDLHAMMLLVPLSLLTSPYGWVYDQMLLLPVALVVFSKCFNSPLTRQAFFSGGALLLANLIMLLMPTKFGQEWFVWYPVVFYGALVYRSLNKEAA